MAKTTNAMFDIEQVTMNTPMDVLIKRGRDNAIQTDPAKLAQMIPVARDPWKRIQKVENKLIKGLIPMRHEKMGADIFFLLPRYSGAHGGGFKTAGEHQYSSSSLW
ncbi:hypothetical protein [Secundilactobacillus kimchicus]|uniref:hypothetical protein n=1 Tax=Secundilactobacillus kimchicus TaxID=528209 RepID=UPI000A9A6A9E|nr:hypothetical protein [Secundilactobacillus kimchicus]